MRGAVGSSSMILKLALDMVLKFYTSVAKGVKLKVRKFQGLFAMFIKATGERLVGDSTIPLSLLSY